MNCSGAGGERSRVRGLNAAGVPRGSARGDVSGMGSANPQAEDRRAPGVFRADGVRQIVV